MLGAVSDDYKARLIFGQFTPKLTTGFGVGCYFGCSWQEPLEINFCQIVQNIWKKNSAQSAIKHAHIVYVRMYMYMCMHNIHVPQVPEAPFQQVLAHDSSQKDFDPSTYMHTAKTCKSIHISTANVGFYQITIQMRYQQ